MSKRPLEELVHSSWVPVLSPVEDTLATIGERLRAETRPWLPAGEHILRAFAQPLDHIKVLIVGQDPYPTPGHPVGLSFSVAPDTTPIPRSLQNIYKELVADLSVPTPSNGDLTPWSAQGVMLLNRVLTVRAGEAGSHRGIGWEIITDAAIAALAQRDIVAILWGKDAQTLTPALGEVEVISSAHPSPMSADRGFFGSRPFSRANAHLNAKGQSPVEWQLP